MANYQDGSDPAHTPVDYDAITRRLGTLGFATGSRVVRTAEQIVRTQHTRSSASSCNAELVALLRWCKQHDIDPLHFTRSDGEYFASSLAYYAVGTQYLRLLWARVYFKRLAENGWRRGANPIVIPHSLKRVPETITPALSKVQAEELLGSLMSEFDDPRLALVAKRDYAVLTVMLRLALRLTETIELRWSGLARLTEEPTVSFIGKGRKPSHLPVPDDVLKVLDNWKRAYEKASGAVVGMNDPVFLGVGNRELRRARGRVGVSPLPRLTAGAIGHMVKARMIAVGLIGPRYAPHALRATAAVQTYKAGSSLLETSQFLRHSSTETTRRYLATLLQEAVNAAVKRIKFDVPVWIEGDDQLDEAEVDAA